MPTEPQLLARIVNFLNSIQISIVEKSLPNDTFLPGLRIEGGTILMDLKQLKYPGNLLHEAGHIATNEETRRLLIGTPQITADWQTDGDEIAAILWSYAAGTHLQLNLDIVFYPGGYKDGSEWLIEQFSSKNYIGLPLLEWMSLCTKEEFPKMNKWLR